MTLQFKSEICVIEKTWKFFIVKIDSKKFNMSIVMRINYTQKNIEGYSNSFLFYYIWEDYFQPKYSCIW